jgi:hypothetical protein
MKKPPKVEDLFPGPSPTVQNASAEALQSKLIDAFESALAEGMSPLEALTTILEWLTVELHRVRTRQDDEAS